MTFVLRFGNNRKTLAIIVSVCVFLFFIAIIFFRRRSNWLVTDKTTTDTTIKSYQTNVTTCDQAYSTNISSGMDQATAVSIRTRCYLAAANTLVINKCTYTDVASFDALETSPTPAYTTLKGEADWIATAYEALLNEFNGIAPSAISNRNSNDAKLYKRSVTIPAGTTHTFNGVNVNIGGVTVYRTDILAARAADISGPTRKFFATACADIFVPAEATIPDQVAADGSSISSTTTANDYTTIFNAWSKTSSYFDSTRLELKDATTGASLVTTSGSITYVNDTDLPKTKAIRNIAAWKVLSLDFTIPSSGIATFPNESMSNYTAGTPLATTALNNITYPAEIINSDTVSPALTGTTNTKIATRVGTYDSQNISNADKALMYGPGSIIPTGATPPMASFVTPTETTILYTMASVSKDIVNMLTALQRPTTGYLNSNSDALT